MADEALLQGAAGSLLRLLRSRPFCLLLSHLTGLDLVEGVVRLELASEQDAAETTGADSCWQADSHGQW